MPSCLRVAPVLLCALLLASPVAAQTVCPNPCTLVAGTPYGVMADHDGVNTTGYRVLVDGAQVGADLPFSALAGGVVTSATLTVPARGSHTIQLAAFNPDWSIASDPLSFAAKMKAPGKPINPRLFTALFNALFHRTERIVVSAQQMPDGSVRFTAR
jgi:hypothetical protein